MTTTAVSAPERTSSVMPTGAPVAPADAAPPPPPASPGTGARIARSILAMVAVIALAFTGYVVFGSGLSERAAQSSRYAALRGQLAQGTAPVKPTDEDGALLAPGTPIAVLRVPALGMRAVVGEGTSGRNLASGPGHLRSTVFPGGAGTSVLFGRAASYGGSFGGIDGLERGDEIIVTTGVGKVRFRVVGVRRAGDKIPALTSGRARLTLVTASGPSYLPSGTLSVDADAAGKPLPAASAPVRSVPESEQPLGTDSSTLWALVLWLEALGLVVAAAVWLWHRRSPTHAWLLCIVPLLWVSTQVARQLTWLLPNLL